MKRTAAFAALAAFACMAAAALPSGLGKVRLGMDVDGVKSALKGDGQFGYRGERDVSISPLDHEAVIETDPTTFAAFSFFERCWFQFTGGSLSVMTFKLNPAKIDHYSIFSTLCSKYGQPDEISPKKSVWRDGSVVLSLEKPLTLKYADAKALGDRRSASNVDKTTSERARDEFLKGL